jgi:hypothetical protein
MILGRVGYSFFMGIQLVGVTSSFIFFLSLGTFLFYPLVNSNLTGPGFVKLMTSISLTGFCIVIALFGVLHSFVLDPSLISLILMAFFSILFYLYHKEQRTYFSWILYFLILTFGFYYILQTKHASFNFLSLAFLGIVNYMMILGHYYLVVPKLSVRPLILGHYIFWPLIGFKICLSYFSYEQTKLFFEEGSLLGQGYIFNMLLISMRILWGYVALVVLSYFSYRLCKMRSTQSATGVLYIMVFFILVGELLSLYLLDLTGHYL